MRVAFLVCSFLALLQLQASTRYVSASGNDTSDGTSTSTPWAHAPGMVTCASTCAAYTPTSDTNIIFKGGDTWTNANFPMTIAWNGTSGHPLYIGVDKTWYTGGSWVQPLFDAQDAKIAATLNGFVDLNSRHYVTLDNIEMKGLYWDSSVTYSALCYIRSRVSDNIILSNLYLHRWTHGGTSADDLTVILGDSNPTYNNASTISNSTIQNADGNNDSGEDIMAWGGSVINCILHDSPNAINATGSGHVSGNLIYNGTTSFTGAHANSIQVLGSNGTHYIHDNVIRDIPIGNAISVGGFAGDTYVWNNISYNLSGVTGSVLIDGRSGTTSSVGIWNNTIVPYAGALCITNSRTGTMLAISIQNNHCITTNANVADATLGATTLTVDHNVLQTPTAATAQGYTSSQSPYVYFPTSGGSTIAAGTDLSANCSGSLAGLCSDTTYAAVRSPVARGVTWDAGAYQYVPPTTGSAMFGTLSTGAQVK